ncbi:hypothetical protein [Bacillus cihuensis]|uniref:hypothetical protein n=1 Tax=Bacillus cihuensis TaxID=1208599 RepID=UPI0006858DAC|nr:hypothetical protein [Bacillus cihuensis]
MNGIILINPNYAINDTSRQESFIIQKTLLSKYAEENNLQYTILNPYQIHSFYTIPHALLYDLNNMKEGVLDCLLLYSMNTQSRFIGMYPEKWLAIVSFFRNIYTIKGGLTTQEEKISS